MFCGGSCSQCRLLTRPEGSSKKNGPSVRARASISLPTRGRSLSLIRPESVSDESQRSEVLRDVVAW